MQKIIDQILTKPVNRKQFLTHLGAGVLTVMGIPLFLKSLHELGSPHVSVRTSGYGSASYGKPPTVSSASSASSPSIVSHSTQKDLMSKALVS